MSVILLAEAESAVKPFRQRWAVPIVNKLANYGCILMGGGAIRWGVFKIDLMVLDMKMPGTKGMDVLKQMRKQGKKIPVVILTGSIDLERYANDLRKIGYASDDALLKPIDLEVLLDKVREKLKRKKNKGAPHARKNRV